jgi:hypothetical protein
MEGHSRVRGSHGEKEELLPRAQHHRRHGWLLRASTWLLFDLIVLSTGVTLT